MWEDVYEEFSELTKLEQMPISACQKSNYITVEMFRSS